MELPHVSIKLQAWPTMVIYQLTDKWDLISVLLTNNLAMSGLYYLLTMPVGQQKKKEKKSLKNISHIPDACF